MHVPFLVCHMLPVQALKWIIHLVVNLCFGIKGATAYPLFLTQKIAVMHWSEPKSYNKPFELLCSHNFGFRHHGHDSCGVLWVFQPCLCICRWVLPPHHHPLWHVTKNWGIRSVPRGGRPDPQFKAKDPYT